MFAQRFSLIAFAVGALLGITIGFGISNLGNVAKPAASDDIALQKIEQLQKAYDLMLAERRVSKLENKVSSIESLKKEIIVFTLPECPPCKDWIDRQSQRFRDAGWSVGVCNKPNHDYQQAPMFHIGSGENIIRHLGSITVEQAESLLQKSASTRRD
jgi:hypothetical protein